MPYCLLTLSRAWDHATRPPLSCFPTKSYLNASSRRTNISDIPHYAAVIKAVSQNQHIISKVTVSGSIWRWIMLRSLPLSQGDSIQFSKRSNGQSGRSKFSSTILVWVVRSMEFEIFSSSCAVDGFLSAATLKFTALATLIICIYHSSSSIPPLIIGHVRIYWFCSEHTNNFTTEWCCKLSVHIFCRHCTQKTATLIDRRFSSTLWLPEATKEYEVRRMHTHHSVFACHASGGVNSFLLFQQEQNYAACHMRLKTE